MTGTHIAGLVSLPLPIGVTASAVYGGHGDCYRYLLTWVWDASKPRLCAGMMNPSTATHLRGDRTVAWVYRWAVRNGFGGLIVVNADAYRATDQGRLAEVEDPCGPDNMAFIKSAAVEADMIILGYGKPKVAAVAGHGLRMALAMREQGKPLYVWGLSNGGVPRHPLYLPANTPAIPWVPS